MSKPGFVYILANVSNQVLYVGVTANLLNRVLEHKEGKVKGFTERYHVHKLVYYEEFEDISDAIMREKQLKAGSRETKMKLICETNPGWTDLFFELGHI
jgi:putative endonuclease